MPDTTLYIVGVSTTTGKIVFKEPVRNPFIDISFIESWSEETNGKSVQQVSGLASESFSTQLSFYNENTGYFGDPRVNDPFWTTANALANAATLAILTGEARVVPVLENSFTLLVPKYATPKDGNDDIQWHAHAWLRAYELTSNVTYLNEVWSIYNELFDPSSPWQ